MNITLSKDTPKLRETFRAKRDLLLAATDPYMFPDRGLSEEEVDQIVFYRQQLRDAPNGEPDATLWVLPVPPIFIMSQSPFNETS